MKSFFQWIEEKKKQDKESSPPTVTSSPLRGANQDQTGFNTKNNVADYTISDSKKWVKEEVEELDEVSLKTKVSAYSARAKMNKYSGANYGDDDDRAEHGDKMQHKTMASIKKHHGEKGVSAAKAAASHEKQYHKAVSDPTTHKAKWDVKTMKSGPRKGKLDKKDQEAIKGIHSTVKLPGIKGIKKPNLPEEVEQIDELISGVGAVRTTPGNMRGSAHTGTVNAPVSGKALQASADRRRMQQDKNAQNQKDEQENVRKSAEAQREKDKVVRDRVNKIREEYLNEGRPKKNKTEEDPGSEHVIMQLRKVITTRGMHKVKHVSGEKSNVDPAHAHKMLAHHDNLKTSPEKQAYAARLHKSAASMKDALAGKPEPKQPKVSLAGKITGTQKG